MALRRLKVEFRSVDAWFNLHQRINDPYILEADFIHHENSRYTGIKLHCEIVFPQSYPFTPPIVRFNPPIFHPNITSTGVLSVPFINKEKWTPACGLNVLLTSIWSIIDDPLFPIKASDKGKEEDDGCECANEHARKLWDNIEDFKTILYSMIDIE